LASGSLKIPSWILGSEEIPRVFLCLGAVILLPQSFHIPPIKELDVDLRIVLFQQPDLAIFLGNQALHLGSQLDIEVMIREIEVRREALQARALAIAL
jgi:hypothetical protein